MAELRKRKPAKAGSAEHRARSSTASRVSKKWSVGASGKRSQGLYNPHSYCYRRTALQALLHMPEFLNWLDGHAHPPTSTAPSAKAQPTNDQTRGISFSKHAPPQASVPPSSEAQTNKTQPTNSKPGEAAPSTQESSEAQANADGGEATSGSEKEAKVHGKCVGKDCLACGLRELCQAYWNSAPKRGEGDRELSRGQVSKFDKLVNRIGPKVNNPFPNWETVAVDVNADAPEFLMWMLSKMSAQGTLPDDIYNALLRTCVQTAWTCKHCPYVGRRVQDEAILNINITKPKRGLHLNDYIKAHFSGEVIEDVRCDQPNCPSQRSPQTLTRFTSLVSAPDVLIIQLSRFELDKYGNQRKISSSVHYSMWLDMTRYQATPEARAANQLTYKLASVVSHSGNMIRGHYLGVFTSSTGVMRISDGMASKATQRALLRADTGFDAYLLVYLKA